MKSGIPIASSRVTVLHSLQRSFRSTFSPVEKRAMTTASSVTCSSSEASPTGSSQRTPSADRPIAPTTPSPR